MEVKDYEPLNPALKKYIHFYYELELKDEAYYAFPSENHVVILFNDAKINCSENLFYVEERETKNNNNIFTALNKFTKPLFIKSKGIVKEFVIVFKPHGLAQFIDFNYHKKFFFKVNDFDSFKKENPLFFDSPIEEKIQKIESFLASILEEKRDVEIVSKSLDLMQNEEFTIQEIAEKCHCSYKKLYRLFLLHCGSTPMTIKKNIRFRNVLKKIECQDENFKLSDVAFEFGYYDQAFFNKAFKQLTGETPKQFFKKVSVLSEKDIYFKSVK